MKLYIATTSLNFDTIVSTDSLSPVSFYKQRGFGISSFYDKASFSLPNSILLTDAFPYFNISRDEVEHRPMVIEIDTLFYPLTIDKVKEGHNYSVYRSGRTIYISPLSCRIFFFSENDKRATLSKSESILESKYILYDQLGAIRVYNRKIQTVKIGHDSFNNIDDLPSPDMSSVEEDRQINKAKGFIVSYLIGAKMAITPESAKLLKLTKDIKNGIYSIVTNNRKKSDETVLSVYRLADEAEMISSTIDPKKIAARNRVTNYLSSLNATSMLHGSSNEEIIYFLNKIGVYSTLFNQLNEGRFPSIVNLVQQAVSSSDDSTLDVIISEISRYINSILQHPSTKSQVTDMFVLSSDKRNLGCNDTCLGNESCNKVELLFHLFSDAGYTPIGIRDNRVQYTIDAGKVFFPKPTDNNKEERSYINAMLDNLEHASSFNLMATNSLALQSLAVFMRSPDADIDKMANSVTSNEIPDARIAFGLWGLFYGYSNIPQGYYNKLFVQSDHNYAIDFTNQLNEIVLGVVNIEHYKSGIDSDNNVSLNNDVSSADVVGMKYDTSRGEHSYKPGVQGNLWSHWNNQPSDFSHKDNISDVVKAEPSAEAYILQQEGDRGFPLSDEGEDLPGYDHIFHFLNEIICAGFKKEATRIYYSNKVKYLCSISTSYKSLISGIDDIPLLNKTKTDWTIVKRKLKTRIEEIAQEEAFFAQTNLSNSNQQDVSRKDPRLFVTDIYAWDVVKKALPNDQEVLQQLEKDLAWFQNNYNPLHKENGKRAYYADYPRDNNSAIINYDRYLRNKQRNMNAPWLRKIYDKVNVDAVVFELKQFYK